VSAKLVLGFDGTDSGEDALALGPRDADLLVCGSRAYGPLRRVLLGGVSSRLLRRSALPLLVVPRGGGPGS
jgi:nucleotide-binding universal stress UspA family protein